MNAPSKSFGPASDIRFRLANDDDTPAIVEIVNAAFSLEAFIEGTRTDTERMQQLQKEGQFLVAQDDAGQVCASAYTEVHGDRGYIGMLAVDPKLQGAGLGRRTMQAAEDHLRERGCKVVDILVLSLRTELLPIYRRFGYVETGTEEFHPTRPLKPGLECHCIRMTKTL
jgi:predicted N-acetyltransferase YhbS